MYTGKVLWFEKTYGFLKVDRSADELFFHWTSIQTDDAFKVVYVGDRVTFDVIEVVDEDSNKKTLKAINVRKVPRMSEMNKPLLRVAFINKAHNNPLVNIELSITSKAKHGLRYVNYTEHRVIATDIELTKSEVEQLDGILLHWINREKIFYTDNSFKYDLEGI